MRNKPLAEDIRIYIKKYYIKTCLVFLGWIVTFALILLFFGEWLFPSLGGWQKTMIYSLFMLSTVFFSKFPKRIANRTFYGTVEKVTVATTYLDFNCKDFWEPHTENHILLHILTPQGKKITKKVVSAKTKTPRNLDQYQQGDTVVHLAGTTHTVILPKPSDSHMICPFCGHSNQTTHSVCNACGHTLIKTLESFQP
jgi:hypothetical protein